MPIHTMRKFRMHMLLATCSPKPVAGLLLTACLIMRNPTACTQGTGQLAAVVCRSKAALRIEQCGPVLWPAKVFDPCIQGVHIPDDKVSLP